MSERKHPLAICEECPLFATDEVPVCGTGPVGPVKIAVVGEAPGFQEATVGRPFVGDSGKVLNELLRNNDIDRSEVWVTNAVACRPEDNATPGQAAIDACGPRLMAELVDHEPEYVLATGATAAKAMGLSGAITKLRVGPPRGVSLAHEHETLVVPTLHPAFALRFPDALPSIDFDISKITKGATVRQFREPTLTVISERDHADDAIVDLWQIPGPFSVDIETGYDKDVTEFHADQQGLLCIGVEYEPDKVVIFGTGLMDDQDFLSELAKLFREKALIMHNGKSDVAGLMPTMGPVNLRHDTMLAHYCLDERTGGHDLGTLGIELLGTPDWKAWTKPYLAKGPKKNFADIPHELLYRYNAMDCSVTGHLWRMFAKALEEQGRMPLHDFLVAAAKELVYPEMDGLAFDMPYSVDLTGQLQDQLSELEQRINDTLGREINPRSPQQVVKLFNDRVWHVPIGKKSGGGKGPTTGKEALEKAMLSGQYAEHPEALEFLDLLFEDRDLSKDDGTYCRGMQKRVVAQPDGSHRIHTTYTLHVATTGRLSSKDPNLQNIKDKAYLRRQFIVGQPGNIFLSGDYSQVEGRVIAVLSGDEYLAKLFGDAERDIFNEISISMYGVNKPELRRLLKTFFYGYSYGRTAHGIANAPEFRMDVDDAQRQLDQFKALIPQVGEWQEKTWQAVQDQGYLETTFGRRRHFPLITNRNKTDVRNEALAFLPQSTASDICLRAFTELRPQLEEKFEGQARIRMTIHDAIVVECPIEIADNVQQWMEWIMTVSGNVWATQAGNPAIPFAVAFKSGTSWDQLG